MPKRDSWIMKLVHAVIGRPLRSSESKSEQISAFEGIPYLGLDALASICYGPEAALAVLTLAGISGLAYLMPVVLILLVVLVMLQFSYRQTIKAYPTGGGAYTVAKKNMGETWGLFAAAALLFDYALNVTVGISAGVAALESVSPAVHHHTLMACLVALALITLVSLRGVHDAGIIWALPTYWYVLSLGIVVSMGLWKVFTSGNQVSPVVAPPALPTASEGLGLWLLIKAFASGCTAMTGVEAVSNAVPVFKEPSVQRARHTLLAICGILGLFVVAVGWLAQSYHIGAMDQEQSGYQTVISQLVGAVLGKGAFYYIIMTGVLAVLLLSANTSFADFPRLCHFLAEDRYLPAAFAIPGRRLVFSFGVLALAILSAILLCIFNGITEALIPLFAVGAFSAFCLSQVAMVLHWVREKQRGLSLWLNALGALVTILSLLVIIAGKFIEGAWIAIMVIPASVFLFKEVRRHYDWVTAAVSESHHSIPDKIPSLHAVLPIEGWNRVSESALQVAMQLSDEVTVLHVKRGDAPDHFADSWEEQVVQPAKAAGLHKIKLEVLESPYRLVYEPLIKKIDEIVQNKPDRLIAVVIPELINPKWWHYLLHNHTADGLRTVLLTKESERLVVVNAPWHLSKRKRKERGFFRQGQQ